MFFKKGDRVVCIDDKKPAQFKQEHFQQWIKEGDFYVIRATSMDLEGNQGVLLEEIRNKPIFSHVLGGNFEPRFNSIRFRKIEATEIEVKKERELCY